METKESGIQLKKIDYRQIIEDAARYKDGSKLKRDIPRAFYAGLYIAIHIKKLQLEDEDEKKRMSAADWFAEQLRNKSFVEIMESLSFRKSPGRPRKDDAQKVKWREKEHND